MEKRKPKSEDNYLDLLVDVALHKFIEQMRKESNFEKLLNSKVEMTLGDMKVVADERISDGVITVMTDHSKDILVYTPSYNVWRPERNYMKRLDWNRAEAIAKYKYGYGDKLWMYTLAECTSNIDLIASVIILKSIMTEFDRWEHSVLPYTSIAAIDCKIVALTELTMNLSTSDSEEFADFAVSVGVIPANIRDTFRDVVRNFDPAKTKDLLYDQWRAVKNSGLPIKQVLAAPVPMSAQQYALGMYDDGKPSLGVETWTCHKCKFENFEKKQVGGDVVDVKLCANCNVARSWKCLRCIKWNNAFEENTVDAKGNITKRGGKYYCTVCSTPRKEATDKELWK